MSWPKTSKERCSKGYRYRIDIAMAIIDPPLEPTLLLQQRLSNCYCKQTTEGVVRVCESGVLYEA